MKGKTQFPALRNALRQRGQKKFRAAGANSKLRYALLSSKVERLSISVTPKYFIKVCNTQTSHPRKLPACFISRSSRL